MSITIINGITNTHGISLPRGLSPSSGISLKFLPTQMTNLAIWLDATDTPTLTFNSTTISSWGNKGNQGVGNAEQATAANQPLYVATGINNLPALESRWDGVNGSLMRIADVAGLNYTAFNAFVVGQMVTDRAVTTQIAGKYATTGNQREHRMLFDATRVYAGGTSVDGTAVTSVFNSAEKVTVGTPFIGDMQYNPTTPLSRITLNNNIAASAAGPASIFNGTASYDFFARELPGTESTAMRISEYLFFTRQLSAEERALVLSYLSAKYGIAIS